ncbi:MAG: type 4a pilus biogenesis protein PilO [Planctomycetota bacterium]
MAAEEWSEKKKMIVTAAVGLFLNACVGYYLSTLRSEMATKETQLKAVKNEIDGLNKIVSQLPLKELTLQNRKAEFASKESKLPDSEGTSNLINEISRLVSKYKCEQLSVTFQPGTLDTTKNYIKDTWKGRFKADFFNWCRLMNEMEERFPRFVAFENMSFTIQNNGMIPTGTKHEISVDIVTYRYPRARVGGGVQ